MFRLIYKDIFRQHLKRPEDGFIKKTKHVANMIF